MTRSLSIVSSLTIVAGGLALGASFSSKPRALVEPDAILEITASSLTSYLSTAPTFKQDIWPRAGCRGTQIDGALRAGSPLGLALGGNPFAHGSGTSVKYGNIRLDQGSYELFDVDLRLPAKGFSWPIGRTYNARQFDGTNHWDSAGYQGRNWFQISNPELAFYDDDANEEATDLLYVIYGADRFVEFKRIGDNKTSFRATNGGAGVIKHNKDATSEPGTYVLTDQYGMEVYFFDDDGNAGSAEGQLWKVIDPAGNVAYLGDATTASTAITYGYLSGKPYKAYDSHGSDGRRHTYSYDGSNRLTQVLAETKSGGTWSSPTGLATVGTVAYAYYTSDGDTYGDNGDLKTVTITTPLTDSGITLVQKKYYRYYEGTYNASTNPGYPHQLLLVLGYEGCRKYDYTGDALFDDDFVGETNANLKPYAEAYFEYDTSRRITHAFMDGGCACSGAGDGILDFEYEGNGSYSNDAAGYDEDEYLARTIVARPDGAYITQYFDECYQPLSRVLTDADPDNTAPAPKLWATYVDRNSKGVVAEVSTPANVTAYTHSSASFTKSTSAGLVWTYALVGSSNTTEGFCSDRKYKDAGTSGSAYFDRTWTYTYATYQVDGSETKSLIVRPVVASDAEYTEKITSGTSGKNTWSFTNGWHGASGKDQIVLKDRATTQPAVSTGNNGSGSANVTRRYWNKDGTVGFEKTALGYITYHGYTNGQRTTLIEDADTAHADFSGITIPTNFGSSGTELHRKSTLVYDAQGRGDTTTANSYTPKNYYSRLKDHRTVTLGFTHLTTGGSTTYYGPVSYTVANQAGQVEVSGVIGLTSNQTTAALTALIEETDGDAISAVDTGTLRQLTTFQYTDPGTERIRERIYFVIPASGVGDNTNYYDATNFEYDDLGRRYRVKEENGTIRRTVFDVRGNVTERWIGTNDNGWPEGATSGTANVVKTEAITYDSGSDKGNGYVTTRTLYVEDTTTDQRVTTYTNDGLGRAILEARPSAPYPLHKYDNRGRRIATGLFSSTSGLTATSDPTSVTTNRLALNATSFDEIGQVWKTVHHKIDDADGSNDETLNADSWYDADRHLIKVDGSKLAKSFYDRLGRPTHHFTLANDNDTAYGDADDVSGDIVLEEAQTTFDSSDAKVIMRALIERFHDDTTTTGALDTNADGNVLQYTDTNVDGRIQITAIWNGLQGVTDEVEYGTYNAATFNRSGLAVPSRSSTALRKTYTYNEDGTLLSVQDPTVATSHVTKFEYDQAGRRTKEIRHYDAAVHTGLPYLTDDNVTTAWAYTDGLMTSLTADVPSGETDQVTTYTYGTTKGSVPNSKIASGHLLQKVTYPDSSDSNDVVKFAYNAQEQVIYKKDQEPSGSTANVIVTDYDTNGLETHRRVTTLGTNFDGAVRRISTTSDSLGRTSLVTQWSSATVGTGTVVNEVRFTYDDWGVVSKYEEDRDSAVDAGGSVNDYEVQYTYAKATTGRNTVRRTAVDMGHGTSTYETITYEYVTGYDADSSRVTRVKDATVLVAAYSYLGVGSVVSTSYPQASVMGKVHSLVSNGTYPDLDRFNRPIVSKWTKDLSTDQDFFKIDVAWDEAGNVTSVDGAEHTGFDVKYSMDDIDRVTRAQEGTLSGGSITTETRDQEWITAVDSLPALSHTGNWIRERLDLNGDGDWGDASEHDDTRTHNVVNGLTAQDTDSNGTNNYTLTYDPAGNLTDDGQSYKHEYDAFNRLRKIKNQSNALVEELTYNGLGHLVGEHYDTDTDGDVDANDKWYYTAYDERWCGIATFRESDTSPKEIFWLQQAGDDGLGGSSYINGVICRYKDANTAWTSASDGTREEVLFYAQNWRGDVVSLVDDSGKMTEWAKYSAYGVPFGLPKGDADSDGDCDSTDANTVIQGWINISAYYVRGDLDLDGDVDTTDKSIASSSAVSLGFGTLSSVSSVFGLGSAPLMRSASTLVSSRLRLSKPSLGRWLTPDVAQFVDGPNLYAFCGAKPVESVDSYGLSREVLDCGNGAMSQVVHNIDVPGLAGTRFCKKVDVTNIVGVIATFPAKWIGPIAGTTYKLLGATDKNAYLAYSYGFNFLMDKINEKIGKYVGENYECADCVLGENMRSAGFDEMHSFGHGGEEHGGPSGGGGGGKLACVMSTEQPGWVFDIPPFKPGKPKVSWGDMFRGSKGGVKIGAGGIIDFWQGTMTYYGSSESGSSYDSDGDKSHVDGFTISGGFMTVCIVMPPGAKAIVRCTCPIMCGM